MNKFQLGSIKKAKFPPGPQKSNAGRKPLFPFERLAAGEAFLVRTRAKNISEIRSLTGAIYRARHKYDLNIHWVKDERGFMVHRLPGKYEKAAKV